MEKKFLVLAIAVILIASAGFVVLSTFHPNNGLVVAQGAKETKIGWIGPLTGGAASFGQENRRGVEMAIDEINANGGINGAKLVLVPEDDHSDNQTAISAFEKISNVENTPIVLGPLYQTFMAFAPKAENAKVVAVQSVDSSEEIAKIGNYVFGIGIYDEGVGKTLAEFAYNNLHLRKAGLLTASDDAFYNLVKNGFIERFQELGGQIVANELYPTGTTDFRTMLIKIKSTNPEIVAIFGYDEAGLAVKQAKELGLEETFMGGDTASSNNFFTNSQDAAIGMYFTSWEPKNKQKSDVFVEKYNAKYGKSPEQYIFVATGYDAMHMAAMAMSNCSEITSACIKNQLYNVKNYNGLAGDLTMSPDGIVRTLREEVYIIEGEGVSHPA